MSLFRQRATHGLLTALSRTIIPQFLRFVRWSWRTTLPQVHPETQALINHGQPVIYALWHGRMFVMLSPFATEQKPTILISRSRDGEFITRVARGLGFRRFVRGSHQRGATMAALGMIRELTVRRRSLLVLADGPKGPRYVIKPGLIKAAAQAGVPIVPVSGACQVFLKELKNSWDGYYAPIFFSPLTVLVGAPLWIEAEVLQAPDRLEAERQRVETALKDLSQEAQTAHPRPIHLIP